MSYNVYSYIYVWLCIISSWCSWSQIMSPCVPLVMMPWSSSSLIFQRTTYSHSNEFHVQIMVSSCARKSENILQSMMTSIFCHQYQIYKYDCYIWMYYHFLVCGWSLLIECCPTKESNTVLGLDQLELAAFCFFVEDQNDCSWCDYSKCFLCQSACCRHLCNMGWV